MTENKELTQGSGRSGDRESGTQQKRFCFSLVLPVHNAEDLLCNTINHLLDQTLSADQFQIIIVDALMLLLRTKRVSLPGSLWKNIPGTSVSFTAKRRA